MDAVKILGSLLNKNALGSKTGGDILGSILGGGENKSGKASGNAGDILSTLLGGKKAGGKGGLAALAAILAAAAAAKGTSGGRRSGGGLEDLLGGLLGGGSTAKGGASAGGLGDLVGGLLGGGKGGSTSGMGGLLGSLLGSSDGDSALATGDGPSPLDPAEAEEEAKLLIEAMCLAARSDGKIDESERETIVGKLGDLDEDEAEFLRKQLSAKTSVESFVKRVPEDMNEQVYAFALMAVKLDSRQEAEFFATLAQGLNVSGNEANEIHARLGQPELFA